MSAAVLLDVDGTLVDSNDAHAHAWSDACNEFGFARPYEFFRPLIGMGADHVLPRVDPILSTENGVGRDIVAARSRIFKDTYLPALRPTAGARLLVERLRADGLRRVIASSAKADELDALLAVADIGELIDIKTTADDAASSKPAADIVVAALSKAQVSPCEVMLIGDTPYDITSGTKANVRVIALRCGGWNDADLTGAIAIYDDPADLVAKYASSPLRITGTRRI